MTENLVVCIARNNLALTRNAVASFFRQDIRHIRVMVIDNVSDDGTRAWLNMRQEQNPDILTMRFGSQKSVAACWNRALTWAFSRKLPYVLVCNNDVVLRPDTMRLLVEHGGPFVTGVGVNTQQQTESCDPKNERPHPDFSCFLIRRECWDRVGSFDEKFEVAFYEDNEYHVRMHRNGIKACCIGVPFHHVGSATMRNADPEEQKRIGEQAQKNKEYFRSLFGCYPGTPEYDALFQETMVS